MSLLPGTHVGSYEILAPLGAGGMGEVYQARDLKLGRLVAIKVLRGDLARDPERLKRFQREARLLAALNHPNIAALFGLEEPEGGPFLVMELVPGKTLAQRLAEGRLRLDEVLFLAQQITQALEAAHGQGIIHRDLKPANIKVTPEGKVKVLDFGLAKAIALEADPAQPTTSYEGTREGVILGTPAYMSPEQARSQSLDKRTDIWSFACVVYQMLSGRPAFEGSTAADILAAILEREPEWSVLPDETPAAVRDMLKRCLRKDQGRRPRDIGDLRLLIEDALEAFLAHPVRAVGTTPADSLLTRPNGNAARSDGKHSVQAADAQLVRLRGSVFFSQVKQLHILHKWGVITGHGSFALGVAALAWLLFVWFLAMPVFQGIWGERVNTREWQIGAVITYLISIGPAALISWGICRWVRKQHQHAIERAIARIAKQFPHEAERWGGSPAFGDPATVAGMLSILETGKGTEDQG
jgi:serine/threonine protein kinase